MYKINSKTVDIARHIFDVRIDNSTDEAYQTWCTARDIFEYVLADNLEALLIQLEYMKIVEEYYGN